jgi:hypothetical protein
VIKQGATTTLRRVTPQSLVLIILGVVLAFWAGSRWRHHTRTWADHKGAVAGEKKLRKLRWVTLRAALIALVATFAYLLANGTVAVHGVRDGQVPADLRSPASPSASCSHGAFGKPVCPAPATKGR